jgi:hypothetical protein
MMMKMTKKRKMGRKMVARRRRVKRKSILDS